MAPSATRDGSARQARRATAGAPGECTRMTILPTQLSLIEALRLMRTGHGHVLTYAILWRAVAEGRVPAHKRGTRWMIDRADVPAALEALGLEPKRQADPRTTAALA